MQHKLAHLRKLAEIFAVIISHVAADVYENLSLAIIKSDKIPCHPGMLNIMYDDVNYVYQDAGN